MHLGFVRHTPRCRRALTLVLALVLSTPAALGAGTNNGGASRGGMGAAIPVRFADATRIWQDERGQKIDAELIGVDGGVASLRTQGKTLHVPVGSMDIADQSCIREWQLWQQAKKTQPGTPVKPVNADLAPMLVKVLVLNYDPFFEGKRLHEVFKWNDPRKMAMDNIADMERASGGMVRFQIVEWRDLDEIYAQSDGYRYTIEEYVRNRRAGKGWRPNGQADYPRLLAEQKVAALVDEGRVDEVWVFSDHFFGLWEASMAGPGAFFINGGVYPKVPTRRPFAFYGFNYERGVECMLHDACHRTECIMNRVYGGWHLDKPTTNWDKFSANEKQSNGAAGVGTCHNPANATNGYDYSNKRVVNSWADDFLNYPTLTGKTQAVSVATWASTGNDHRDYMGWYFRHLPRAGGTNADGKLNNWWRYLYDLSNYTPQGRPLNPSAMLLSASLDPAAKNTARVAVGYSSAGSIDLLTCTGAELALELANGTRLTPESVTLSDPNPGGYRVAVYWFSLGGGRALTGAQVALAGDRVRDLAGAAVPGRRWPVEESLRQPK